MIGRTIGPYEVLEKLGEGGMGVVYKARDRRLQRHVALKFLSGRRSSPATELRFLREAQAASALNHPNIVTIYDIGREGDSTFIVMEYLEGNSLEDLIPADGFEPGVAIDYSIQLAEALSAAHAANIIHRDLKPANIVVGSGGRIKVLDFGLAKFEAGNESETTSLTVEGAILGTIAYLAPEQSMSQAVDHRADIFSFGVILHELLTGARPFTGPNPVALIHEINYGTPKGVRALKPDLPATVEAAVLRMLEKQPEDRLQTMAEVLTSLRASRAELDVGAGVATFSKASAGGRAAAPATTYERAPVSTPPSAGSERTSIAVLPFRSLSGDKEDSYLAEGISLEIIRALSGVPGIRVASQLASFRFKEEAPDLASVADALQIKYVLTGSMRRAGNRIRVIAELSDAVEGSQIWSRTYERGLEDFFAVQDEIADSIVGSTGGQIIRARSAWAASAPPETLDAWGLVRKAYHFVNFAYHSEAINEALRLLRRAIALAPEYALAHAFLGLYLSQRVVTSIAENPAKDRAESLAAVDRAIELAPGDPEVLESSGLVLFNGGKHERALHVLRRAVEIAPFNLVAWGYIGLCLGWCGEEDKIPEAQRIFDRLITNSPDHPSLPYWLYFRAGVYTREGNYEEAAECSLRSLELQPRFTIALAEYANALGCLGRFDEAREVMGRVVALNPHASAEAYRTELLLTNRTKETAERHVRGLVAAGIFKG